VVSYLGGTLICVVAYLGSALVCVMVYPDAVSVPVARGKGKYVSSSVYTPRKHRREWGYSFIHS
jgi:hypothetical protein